jgi:hypothetical protein
VLPAARVEIKRGGISHVATGTVRHNGYVIAYLVLVRIAFQGIKRVTYCHIRRPRYPGIRAIGVEQLRVGVVGNRVARVVPHSVQPSIRRYGECAEPMPLIGKAVVINSVWRAES